MAPRRGSTPGLHTASASLGSSNTNLFTGRSSCLTGPSLLPSAWRVASPRSTCTERIYPSSEGYVFDTRANCQQFLGRLSSFYDHVTNRQVSSRMVPLSALLEAQKELLSPATPKFISKVLDSSPSFS